MLRHSPGRVGLAYRQRSHYVQPAPLRVSRLKLVSPYRKHLVVVTSSSSAEEPSSNDSSNIGQEQQQEIQHDPTEPPAHPVGESVGIARISDEWAIDGTQSDWHEQPEKRWKSGATCCWHAGLKCITHLGESIKSCMLVSKASI